MVKGLPCDRLYCSGLFDVLTQLRYTIISESAAILYEAVSLLPQSWTHKADLQAIQRIQRVTWWQQQLPGRR